MTFNALKAIPIGSLLIGAGLCGSARTASQQAPQPAAQPGLKFHAAPKPLAHGAVTHEWRDFLGPTHNAISTESPIAKALSPGGPPRVWEVSKGEGYASPAVVGGRVILFHRVENDEVVEALDAETGRRFWRFAYPISYQDRFGWNGGPRCQPVSDGERVYTYGVDGKLHCLSLATGQVVWKKDIPREMKAETGFFGNGATPLLEGDLLIVNAGVEGGPTVAAFDRRSGKLVWGAGKEWGASYASPIPAAIHGKRRVFVFAGGESRPPTGGLLCIDPANGKVDFAYPWRARRYESVNASCPVIIGDQVFISECYGRGCALLDVQPDGSAHKVWENNDLGTHFMTAIQKDGYLYGIDGHGPQNAPLICMEIKTGKVMWRAEPDWPITLREDGMERKVSLGPGLASLLLVDGRCLMLGEYGQLVWLDLNPKGYREISRAQLFLTRGECWSMPVLSRGLLYVCQNSRGLDGSGTRLLCYDLRDSGPPKPAQ